MNSSAATKPIPTPAPVVKYQPPFMKFLRSNAGSRSTRVRSRSIPLFTRRKRSAINGHQQEPSSPKVTCIGQVRIRRSSSKTRQSGLGNRDPPPPPPLKRRTSSSNSGAGNWFCFWVGKPPAVCCSFRFSRRKSCFRPLWRKWVSFLCCKSDRVRTDSPKKDPIPTGSCLIYTETDSDSGNRFEDGGEEYEDEEEDEDTEEHNSGRVPPKNALLLTRCRSAPQRSSYLASQFWGSPPKTREQENRETTAEKAAQIQGGTAAEPRVDREGEGSLEIPEEDGAETESVVGVSNKTETVTMKTEVTVKSCAEEKQSKQEEEEEEDEERIVVLTRCKSEPARRSGDPLSSGFWRERRFESTVSCRNSVERECQRN